MQHNTYKKQVRHVNFIISYSKKLKKNSKGIPTNLKTSTGFLLTICSCGIFFQVPQDYIDAFQIVSVVF